MFFDAKFLTILAFAAATIFSLFVTKSRINAIVGVIISYFLLLLFLNLIFLNYEILKEISLILTLYFACILTICAADFSINFSPYLFYTKAEINIKKTSLFLAFLTLLILVLILLIFVSKNIENVHQKFEQNKFEQQRELMFGSGNYLQENNLEIINENNRFLKSAQIKTYADDRRISYFKEYFSKHFLLQNFSMVILFISGVLIISTMLYQSKKE